MKRYLSFCLSIIAVAGALTSCSQENKEPAKAAEQQADEKHAIERIKSYVQAFNDRDIDKLAEFWSDEAIYRNSLTGELAEGREGIKKEFTNIFANINDAKVDVRIDATRFPMEDKFVGEGVAWVVAPGDQPVESPYKVILIKKQGEWYILNVSQLDFSPLKAAQ